MLLPLSRLALALALAALVVGCAETPELPKTEAVAEALDEERFALLSITSESRETGEAEVTAQFVSFAGPDSDWALSVLDLWVPDPGDNGMLDACQLAAQPLYEADPNTQLPDYHIELLDAGRVTLSTPDVMELQPHYLPDLQLYLNGTLYTLEHSSLASEVPFVFAADGGATVDAFQVEVMPPSPVILETLDGFAVDPSVEMVLPTTSDMEITWSTAGARSVVYFDLYDDARAAAPLMSCVAADDGRFAVPSAAIAELRTQHPDGALRLVLRRVTTQPFPLAGFAWARVVLATSDTVFVR